MMSISWQLEKNVGSVCDVVKFDEKKLGVCQDKFIEG